MAVATILPVSDALRRVQRLQVLTIVWMTVEALIAIVAARAASSPALLGFGGDSAIELFSAVIVLWRFRWAANSARNEKLAARIAGVALFAVASYVVAASALVLVGHHEPRPSLTGIVLLIVAAFGMPWLARKKRKLANDLSSASLKADAVQSSLCGYLSWIALAGLLVNAVFHQTWADPVAALVLVPLIVKEAWEAVHAQHVTCECS